MAELVEKPVVVVAAQPTVEPEHKSKPQNRRCFRCDGPWTSCNEKLQIKVKHCLLDLWAGGPHDKKLYIWKRISESWCVGNSPRAGIEALPLVDVLVHGQQFKALVDTGCSMAILTPKACTS